MLTLAAIYYHRDLGVARAGVDVAEAGLTTAGTRPNPSIAIAPTYATGVPSPWAVSIIPTIPLETAGKRRRRMEAAGLLIDVARLRLAETAWQVRSRLRVALADWILAGQQVDLLRSEVQIRVEIAGLLQKRFDVGEIPRPDLDTAQIDLSNARLAVRTAEGQLGQAKVTVASAIGIPATALDGINIAWPEIEHPLDPLLLSPAEVHRSAVLNRLDIRRSLAEYAASESALRSEIAKQYPNIDLQPGYNFDAGTNKYTLGISLTLPLFNRNQGPIAESEARRKQVEQRFLALQAQAVGESEKALEGYRSAAAELKEASVAVQMQQEKRRLAQKSFDQGETDKLTVSGIDLQGVLALRGRVNALIHVQSAVAALENAIQKPVEPAWSVPDLPSSDHPQPGLVKEEPK